MKTDPLFYRLFQEHPAMVFELADRRWLSAIFLHLHRHRISRCWWAVVVFPDRATDVADLTPFAGLVHCGLLYRVYLEDLLEEAPDPTAEHRFGRRLARLVVLDRERTLHEARALVEAASGFSTTERYRILDLIETIMVYKLSELSRDEIQTMLHLPETDLKKTRFYQDVFSEGQDAGREEGRQKEAHLVLRQLRRRIGPVAEARERRIRALPVEQIEDLGEALLEFRSPADLDDWLDAL